MKYGAISIIYNPNSTGSSDALATAFKRDILERFPKQKVSLRPTEYPGHAEVLAYELAKEAAHPLIISSSGDGGYHEVINGVLRARHEGFDAVAGLLPGGNANDHYRNLHREPLIDLIEQGNERLIDVLKFEGTAKGKTVERYGHSYIGLGLTPFVAKRLNKNKLNFFNQIWIVIKALLSLRSVKLNLGEKPHYYDSVIFSNVTRMSKYLKISQPSQLDDGKFEVTIFKKRQKLQLIALLLKATFTGLKEDAQVSEYSLLVEKKTSVQIDGEIIILDAESRVRVTIEQQALPCLV